MNRDNYITIQGWMILDLDVTNTELICYAIIYGFSQNNESSFNGSLKYLEKAMKSSRRTVQRTLISLEEKGLISKHVIIKNNVTFNHYVANVTPQVKMTRGGGQNDLGGGQNDAGGVVKMTPNNTSINKLDNKLINKLDREQVDLISKIGKRQTQALKKAGAENCDPELRKKIIDWLGYRREIGKPLTARSITSLIKTWSALPRAQLRAAIKHSIDNGYQGLFYDKFNQDGTPRSASPKMHSQPTFGHSEETSRRFREMANS